MRRGYVYPYFQVYLTGSPPVRLRCSEWPVILSKESGPVRAEARQNADGRVIVTAVRCSAAAPMTRGQFLAPETASPDVIRRWLDRLAKEVGYDEAS